MGSVSRNAPFADASESQKTLTPSHLNPLDGHPFSTSRLLALMSNFWRVMTASVPDGDS